MSFPLKNRPLSRTRRSLLTEPLEDRLLLSATGWGGFDPTPDVNVYAVEASDLDIDFGGDTDFDQIAAADMNSDGVTDLVTVTGSDRTPVISVYLGKGGGAYNTARICALGTLSGSAVSGLLADVTGDGILEYVAAAQNTTDGRSLDISVYRYNGTGFALAGTSNVSLSVFGNYAVYAVTSIRLAAVGDDLAVQLENSYAFDSSGGAHSIDGLAVCVGNGTGTFSAPALVASFSGQAVGSARIGDVDYLVSLNKETRTYGFWYYNAAKSAWSSAGSVNYASELGSIAVVGTAVSGTSLRLSGTRSGSGIVAEFSLALSAGRVVLSSSQSCAIENVYSAQSLLVSGDMNSDGYNDLMLVDPNRYTVLFGRNDGSYVETGTTVAQTDYLTTALVNPDGDGRLEVLAVGGIGIWKIQIDAIGSDPVQYALFDTPASAAVTGDFDGDGTLEVAVIESETGRVAIYDFAAGSYEKVLLVEAPTQTVGSATLVARPAELLAGRFKSTSRDQVLIRYTWATDSGDTFLVYDAVQKTQVIRLDLAEGETVSAMAAGRISSGSYDDLVAAVAEDGAVSLVHWGNAAGTLTRKNPVALGSESEIAITAMAVGNLDGRGRGDVVMLDTGSGARLGWLTSASSSFAASGLGWGNRIAADGVFSRLVLADITGDGHLDAVTVRTHTNTAGTARSVIYMAEGTGDQNSPFGALTACPLGGEYAAGIEFDGGSLAGPSLTACSDSITGLGDLILAKGRTAAAVYSLEGGTGDESFLYLVHASSSNLPASILSDPSLLGSDYYTWVDEWSSFYVEIWGNANGSEINRFSTTVGFDPSLFTAAAVESGSGYTASISVSGGECVVSGSAVQAASPAVGRYALLARVLFTATPAGGVAIPESGAFAAYDAGFSASGESINGSSSCSGSDASALTGLQIFSVRFDSNDDGSIDVMDFTLFSNNYGLGTAGKPFKNQKAETFNVVAGGGLNVQDFTAFANAYGKTRAKVVADRFYDSLGIDPTEWLVSALALPVAGELAEPPAGHAQNAPVILLVLDDQDEYEWFDFDSMEE